MMGELCTAHWLAQQLTETGRGNILLLDCRTQDDYVSGHVIGSLCVVVPTLMLRRMLSGASVPVSSAVGLVVGDNSTYSRTEFVERCRRCDVIVLYDVAGSRDAGVITGLMMRLKLEGHAVMYLQGGYQQFHRQFSHLCVGSQSTGEPETTPSASSLSNVFKMASPRAAASNAVSYQFPVEVLPYLYLGNAEIAQDFDCLNRYNIRYVVNVTNDVPNAFADRSEFKYLRIPINDHDREDVAAFFVSAFQFIDEARLNNCAVLIHCLAGISRSVTITVAYLMKSGNLSLNDAYDQLRRCRPNISPNFNFLGQLVDYERLLRTEQGGQGQATELSAASSALDGTFQIVHSAMESDSRGDWLGDEHGGAETILLTPRCCRFSNATTPTVFSPVQCGRVGDH